MSKSPSKKKFDMCKKDALLASFNLIMKEKITREESGMMYYLQESQQ